LSLSVFNLERFEVKTMSAENWSSSFYKIPIKFHDNDGFFGAEKFDFFTYSSKRDVGKFGFSRAYILLHTKKSLQNMRDSVFESIAKKMKEFGIDVYKIIECNLIIYAYDKEASSTIGRGGLTIQFPPNYQRKGVVKNAEDAKQICQLEGCTGEREGEKEQEG